MKIGVLTYHKSRNYGAYLQAYSLSHFLNKMDGVKCEIIDYYFADSEKHFKDRIKKRPIYFWNYRKQDNMFIKYKDKQLLSEECLVSNDIEEFRKVFADKYDIIVTGSDEIWRIGKTRGFPNVYWLPGDYGCIKMSYAASSRMNYKALGKEKQNLMREFYSDYSYIGVRDEFTQSEISGLLSKKDVHINCDPVFFYDRFRNKEILKKEIKEKYNIKLNKKIVAVLYDRPQVITQLKKRLGKQYEFICIYRPMWNADKNLTDIDPFEWVDIIGGADYLVTSYYHGMMFSINQDTPFRAIDRRATKDNLETSKLYDFLKREDILDYYSLSTQIDSDYWDALAEEIRNYAEGNVKVSFAEVVEHQKSLAGSFIEQIQMFSRKTIKNENAR